MSLLKLNPSADPGRFRGGESVKIVGKHPHTGKHGVIDSGPYTSETFPDWKMWRVKCEDGSECFVDAKNLKRSD